MKLKYLLLVALLIGAKSFAQVKPVLAYPFEDEIKVFKHQDSLSMPQPGGDLFIGSSSIRKWVDLPAHFPGKPVIMRGVGGSTIAQWLQYYMPSVVYPYKPAKIFIYVGENDLAEGKGAQFVYDKFVNMLDMIKTGLPAAQVYFMSIKLSPSRAKYYNETKLADKLISTYIATQQNVHYIDVGTSLLTPTAVPDTALFQSDMLHLKPNGYDKWEKIIGSYL